MLNRLPVALWAALWGTVVAGAASAAPAPEGQPWTLDYCIRTACEKHGSALSAADQVDAARQQVRSAGSSLFFPTLSARTARTAGYSETTGARPGQNLNDQENQLSLNLNLWDGGVQKQSVRQARAGEASAEANLRRARQTLAYNVTSAYTSLLRAQHTLTVTEQQLAQAEEQKKMVQAKIEAGAAADVDIYPIEVQIASAKVNKISAQSDVRVAASALRNAMGLEAGPTPVLAELPETLPEVPSLEECQKQALANRPELQQALATIDRDRAGLELARIKTRPQFVSGASLNRGLGGTLDNNQWQITAGITWNFWDRAAKADVAAAGANVRAAQEDHAQLLKDVAAEVEQAHLALDSARERVAAAAASVAAARKNLDVANEKFRLGLAITIELVDAQIASSNAELQAVQARYDYFLAQAQLDKALGKDVDLR